MKLPIRIGLLTATLALATTAHAQLYRTYLASDGSDANPCTLLQPCRLLPRGLATVADHGAVWILDSGNFNTGAVAVTKPVTILAVPGAQASITAFGKGLDITAPESVTVRNLSFQPFTSVGTGMGVATSGGLSLNVENCRFENLERGIQANSSTALRVVDSTFETMAYAGIALNPGGFARISGSHFHLNFQGAILVFGAHATISRSTLSGGQYGVRASQQGVAVISDSILDSGGTGVEAGAQSQAYVNNSTITGAGTGISAGTDGKVVVSGSTIVRNNYGYVVGSGGTIESAGNNVIRDNGTNTGALTPFTLQ